MTAIPSPAPADYKGPGRPIPREFDWPTIAQTAPVLAQTMLRYLDQIALSLRPTSVISADGILRRFAGYLTTNHPEIDALVDVERCHIEAFKRYLPTRPGKNGRPPLSDTTIRMAWAPCGRFLNGYRNGTTPTRPTGC